MSVPMALCAYISNCCPVVKLHIAVPAMLLHGSFKLMSRQRFQKFSQYGITHMHSLLLLVRFGVDRPF